MKTVEQQRARELRALEWSIKEIERSLGVSRSSVSLWVRDVPVNKEQRSRLMSRIRLGPMISAERSAAAAREVRRAYQAEGRRLLNERGPSYVAGCMLYWAEGSKSRNTVSIANSDPKLLEIFVQFIRDEFDVPNERFSIYCNLFADHIARQREIEQFWLNRLQLTQASLRKTTINVYSKYSQKKRVNKLPYGTCKVTVHSTRIVQTIYGSIQEYGGFERPQWLA